MWLEDWDDVRLEQFVGNWKADIVIYRKEEPIAIIEICATHQMDESKRLGYSELNIQWVEVEASEKIFLIDDTVGRLWNIGTPLQYKVCEPVVPTFICEDCIKAPEFYRQEVESRLEKERCERLAASREKREKKKRCLNYLTRHNYIVNAKSLCFLCDDGYLEYHELIAYERCAEKSPFERLEIYIKDGEKGDIIASEEAPITDESKRRLKDNLRRWQSSKSLRSKRINITDSWVSFDDVERLRQTWKPPFVWNWEKKVWIPK